MAILKIKKISFSFVLFLLNLSVFGQQLVGTMETQASVYFERFEFDKALRLYLKLDSISPKNPQYIYPIVVCYINELRNEEALPYVEECLKTPERYPRNLDFYAAKAYQLSHRFDDAIVHYEIYKEKLAHKNKKKNKKLIDEVVRELQSCEYAKQMVAKPLDIKIVNIGDDINSPYADYGPVLSADEQTLIFTSARPGTTGGEIDESDGRYYEDIYISYKTDSGWTAPKNIGTGINTNGHDASISLSPDGQKLLIYRFNYDVLSSGIPGDLYVSRLKGDEWTQATKLPENINTKSWEPSACFSADEKVLFFASNKEGGKGGTDLYMVRKLPNGEWALPMNLGNKINTPFDEDSPFIHPDGKTLYFSSNGHRTMGGFDIFVSKFDEEKNEWGAPENLGYPINTAHDDIHFALSADGRRVYFSSIRPEGKGDNDIYYADMQKDAAKVLVVKGIVKDSVTNSPTEANITVFDNKTHELIGIFNSNSSTGKYIIVLPEGRQYNFTVEANGYKMFYENFDASQLKDFEEWTKNIFIVPNNHQ